MCSNAPLQLGLLCVRQSDAIWRLGGNAIPYVFDELDALGDRQFQVFSGGDGSLHGHSKRLILKAAWHQAPHGLQALLS